MSESTIRILGLKLVSPNRRRGQTKGAAMAHAHHVSMVRNTVQLHVASKELRKRGRPTSVHFVRIAPRRMDADNHIASWKAAADGMCRALGFDDKALVIAEVREGVQATYEQRAEGRLYGIEIHLRWA